MLLTLRLYYLSLYGNASLAICFLVLLPWLVYKIFPAVAWLSWVRPLMWFVIGWFWAFGALLILDFANAVAGGSYQFDIWVKAIAATVLMGLCIVAHFKWPWLNRLYPEDKYFAEIRCNQILLQKMDCWDRANPIARFESRSGVVIDANAAAEQLLGYSLADMLNGSAGFMIHPVDYQQWVKRIASEDTTTMELRVIHKSGSLIWVELHSLLAPYDKSLRMTFAQNVTKYRELLHTQIRDRQRVGLQADRKEAMNSMMRAASEYGTNPE